VKEPLEKSLQALERESSLLLQLLCWNAPMGPDRLSWLRQRLTGSPAFPFSWTSCQREEGGNDMMSGGGGVSNASFLWDVGLSIPFYLVVYFVFIIYINVLLNRD
jgi:hypothetical protein